MNKVVVRINGNEYPMVGEKSEAHMINVAAYVDKEIKNIMEANEKLSSSMASILAAVNIADVFYECSDSHEKLRVENEKLKDQVGVSGNEFKLQVEQLEVQLQNIEKKEASYKLKVEELSKVVKEQKESVEELESYKSRVEALEIELKEAKEKADIAEQMSSKFQNDAYKIQLEKIELENEVKHFRAIGIG